MESPVAFFQVPGREVLKLRVFFCHVFGERSETLSPINALFRIEIQLETLVT